MSVQSGKTAELGLAGRIAGAFIDSKLTPLIIITSVLLGVAAVFLLPREEEPQIKVPMIDVLVAMPGFSAKEVGERATRPMEKLLWEIPGVEYIYSTSRPGESLAVVRFKVGEEIEKSLVKLNQKLQANFDRIPHGVSFPMIKPKSIDDVPILALTFHSERYDHLTLRRLGPSGRRGEAVPPSPRRRSSAAHGGSARVARSGALASRGLSPVSLVPMLRQANKQFAAGGLTSENQEVVIETGAFLQSAEDVGNVVVGVYGGKPVYLREVADITDGEEEPSQYVLFGARRGGGRESAAAISADPRPEEAAALSRARPRVELEHPAVTLSIAKRPGANAISVAKQVLKKVEMLQGSVIPADGRSRSRATTARPRRRTNELLFHMGLAVFGVAILILLFLGWRESLVVMLAIPVTLGLTLLVFYLYGYTLNRITLFALIFSIGILVDDAIVVVENIVRHMSLPSCRTKRLLQIAVEAVDEVGNPTILATWAVIAAVLPMAFVSGMMGPYMRPIPIGSSAAMFFSLAIAFIVTPWAAVRVLRSGRRKEALSERARENGKTGKREDENAAADETGPSSRLPVVPSSSEPGPPDVASSDHQEDRFTRLYRRIMGPLIERRRWRYTFLAGIVALLLTAMALMGLGWVKVKMLPFDNKSEFQISRGRPEGRALEGSAQAAREVAAAGRGEPEVTDYRICAGVAGPFNFDGLVRHYFMRRGSHVADIQVNLVNKHDRKAQSHDIAKRVRPRVAAIAEKFGARVAVAEVPPGPPVLQTLVAEIYGPTKEARLALAKRVRDIFKQTPGVVDVDWHVEADQPKARFVIDKEKAALHGISAETISRTLRIAVEGESIDLTHQPREKEDESGAATSALSSHVAGGIAGVARAPRRKRAAGTRRCAALPAVRCAIRAGRAHRDRQEHLSQEPHAVTYVIGDVAVSWRARYAILKMNEGAAEAGCAEFVGRHWRVSLTPALSPLRGEGARRERLNALAARRVRKPVVFRRRKPEATVLAGEGKRHAEPRAPLQRLASPRRRRWRFSPQRGEGRGEG